MDQEVIGPDAKIQLKSNIGVIAPFYICSL